MKLCILWNFKISILNMIIFFSSTISKLPKRGIFGHKFKVLFWMKFCSLTNLKGRKGRGKKINCWYRNLFNFVALPYLGNLFYDLLRHLIRVTFKFFEKKKKIVSFPRKCDNSYFSHFPCFGYFFPKCCNKLHDFCSITCTFKKIIFPLQ